MKILPELTLANGSQPQIGFWRMQNMGDFVNSPVYNRTDSPESKFHQLFLLCSSLHTLEEYMYESVTF